MLYVIVGIIIGMMVYKAHYNKTQTEYRACLSKINNDDLSDWRNEKNKNTHLSKEELKQLVINKINKKYNNRKHNIDYFFLAVLSGFLGGMATWFIVVLFVSSTSVAPYTIVTKPLVKIENGYLNNTDLGANVFVKEGDNEELQLVDITDATFYHTNGEPRVAFKKHRVGSGFWLWGGAIGGVWAVRVYLPNSDLINEGSDTN